MKRMVAAAKGEALARLHSSDSQKAMELLHRETEANGVSTLSAFISKHGRGFNGDEAQRDRFDAELINLTASLSEERVQRKIISGLIGRRESVDQFTYVGSDSLEVIGLTPMFTGDSLTLRLYELEAKLNQKSDSN